MQERREMSLGRQGYHELWMVFKRGLEDARVAGKWRESSRVERRELEDAKRTGKGHESSRVGAEGWKMSEEQEKDVKLTGKKKLIGRYKRTGKRA